MDRRKFLKAMGSAALIGGGYLAFKQIDNIKMYRKNNFVVIEKTSKKWPPVKVTSGDATVRLEGYDQLMLGAVYGVPGKYWGVYDKVYVGMHAEVPTLVEIRGYTTIFEHRSRFFYQVGYNVYSDRKLSEKELSYFQRYREAILEYRGALYKVFVYLHMVDNEITPFMFFEDRMRMDVALDREFTDIGIWHELGHTFSRHLRVEEIKKPWKIFQSLSQRELDLIDESTSLYLPEEVGHPHDNADEMMASAFTTLKFSKSKKSKKLAEEILVEIVGEEPLKRLLKEM